MKKIYVMLLLLCSLSSLCAHNNNEPYILLYSLSPWSSEPLFIDEYKFNDDGLLKRITVYDIHECIDYYQWNEIKSKAKILKTYEIIRDEDKVTEYLIQNGNKQVFKELILEDIEKEEDFVFVHWILDDTLRQFFRYKINYETLTIRDDVPPIPFTIEFDDRNVYNVIYPSIEGFPFETKEVIFVSEHINFTEQASMQNELLNPINPYASFIFSETVIPREEYSYKSGNGNMAFSKKSLKISQKGTTINLEDFTITDSSGMEYIYKDGKKQGLLLKNSDFVIYYRSQDSTPFFIGYNPDKAKTITEPDNLSSSSYLKEPSVTGLTSGITQEVYFLFIAGKSNQGLQLV